jgi:hypothetical protein
VHKDGIERIESKMKEQQQQQKWKQMKGMNWNGVDDGKEEPWKYDLGKWLRDQGRLMFPMTIFLMEHGVDY